MDKEQEHDRITQLVQEERERIRANHGTQDMHPAFYLAILSEEVGEVAQAVNDWHWEGGGTLEQIAEELIQVAAVAMDFHERIQRMMGEKQ